MRYIRHTYQNGSDNILIMPNTGRNAEKQDHSYIVGGNVKVYRATLEKSIEVSYTTKHALPI